MQLTDFTDEALQKELERRAQAKSGSNRPPRLDPIDVSELCKLCEEYLTQCEREGYVDDDLRRYIFEEALEMFYGGDVWKYVNALLK